MLPLFQFKHLGDYLPLNFIYKFILVHCLPFILKIFDQLELYSYLQLVEISLSVVIFHFQKFKDPWACGKVSRH